MTSEANPPIEESDSFLREGFFKLKSVIFPSDVKELELVVSQGQDKIMKRRAERKAKQIQLDTALKEKDLPAIRDLIHEKVAQEDSPQKVTCHLNDKLDQDNEKSKSPIRKGLKEVKEKIVEIGHEIEMLDEEDVSFIDKFFNRDFKCRSISVSRGDEDSISKEIEGNLDIVGKLESLKSEKWTEKQLKCFFRIFLTAAAREKRHDIVDVMLHMIRRQGGHEIMESSKVHHQLNINATDLHNSILTYSFANHEDTTFQKTPLQWAVENHDLFSLIEFLRIEKEYHENKEDGLYCLRHQLTNDLNLNVAISQFGVLYEKEKSSCEQRMEALPIIVPLIISFTLYCLDVNGDITLSVEYRDYSLNDSLPVFDNNQNCSNSTYLHARPITADSYKQAFLLSAIFASSSLVTALVMVLISRNLPSLCKKLWSRSKWRFALLMLLMPLPPLFLFTIYLIYSYRHSASSKKSKERAELEKAEYLWNTVDTVEAGFEASGEILLQVWLLGPQILHITNMGMKEFIDGIFFLEDATDTEKSLGKVIIAVLSIVYSVGECYRVQKREAVSVFFDIFPVYISLLLQVIGRVIAFSMFMSASKGSNVPETLIFLGIHITLVFVIKLCYSRKEHVKIYELKMYNVRMRILMDLLASACSCLVYIDIRDSQEANVRKCRDCREGIDIERLKEDHKSSTTFYSYFYFFFLVLVENIIMAAWEELTYNRVTKSINTYKFAYDPLQHLKQTSPFHHRLLVTLYNIFECITGPSLLALMLQIAW